MLLRLPTINLQHSAVPADSGKTLTHLLSQLPLETYRILFVSTHTRPRKMSTWTTPKTHIIPKNMRTAIGSTLDQTFLAVHTATTTGRIICGAEVQPDEIVRHFTGSIQCEPIYLVHTQLEQACFEYPNASATDFVSNTFPVLPWESWYDEDDLDGDAC